MIVVLTDNNRDVKLKFEKDFLLENITKYNKDTLLEAIELCELMYMGTDNVIEIDTSLINFDIREFFTNEDLMDEFLEKRDGFDGALMVKAVLVAEFNTLSHLNKEQAFDAYTTYRFDDTQGVVVSTDGKEFDVYSDEEANDIIADRAADYLGDYGVETLPKYIVRDEIINGCLADRISEDMFEDSLSYAEDIKTEQYDAFPESDYINRLHEEMVELGILEEPEWPDMKDYENEGDWQEAVDAMKDDIERALNENIEEFAEKRNEDFEPDEYLETLYGNINDYFDMIDVENDQCVVSVIEKYLLEYRGSELASYDGEELEAVFTFKDVEYTLYIYRQN